MNAKPLRGLQRRRTVVKSVGRRKGALGAAHGKQRRQGITTDSFPIVGIGASAGGLEAFTKLLKHLDFLSKT